MKRFLARITWSVALLTLLGGCGRSADEPGIAATVNGAPITVAALEARHDLGRLGLPAVTNPAVARLRSEYGSVLTDMIVGTLVGQELARRHLAVTDAELTEAEATVRADYAGDAFARMLLEEHIDLHRWREALRDRLTVEKFARKVLRPNIRVGVSEAADYYKAHIDDFTKPARVVFLLVESKNVGALQAALAAYAASGNRHDLTRAADVSAEELTVPVANLSKAWKQALGSVKPGEASSLLSDGNKRLALVLLQRQGEGVLEPAKAYARVEAILSDAKQEQAFATWLGKALAEATIRVNTALLAERRQTPPPTVAAKEADKVEETTAKPATAGGKSPEQKEEAAAQAEPTPVATPPAANESGSEKTVGAKNGLQPPTSPEPPAAASADTADAAASALAANAPAKTAAPEKAAVTSSPETDGAATKTPAAQTAPPEQPAGAAPTVAKAGEAGTGTAQEVEFAAVKASWILYTVDEKPQERIYLKPKKPFRISFTTHLSVRLGTPSEVTYRFNGQEKTVEVKKKESRVLEFP